MPAIESSKRRLSTGWELVIGALIGAVLGWPITKALDGWAAESKLPWWGYLIGTAIGIAIVLFLMTFFINAWRRVVWGWLPRALDWVWSWRPVSARGLRTALAAQAAEMETVAKRVAEPLIKDTKDLDKHISDQVRRALEVKALVDRLPLGMTPTTPPPPPLPAPEPRWSLTQSDEDEDGLTTFTLENLVPESIANNVRFEAQPTAYFGFEDAAFWRDMSGQSKESFTGEILRGGREKGVKLVLHWLDESRNDCTRTWSVRASDEDPDDPWTNGTAEQAPF